MLEPYDFSMSIGPLVVALILISLIIGIRLLKKGSRSFRLCLYIVLLLGTIEFAIFRNPIFFKIFWLRISTEQIGHKQRDCLRLDFTNSEKSWKKNYVAVGSSQTQAVFAPAREDHQDLEVISSAGMTPVEIWWYRNLIKKHCNGTVLLHLSELDLVRRLDSSSFKLSPQGNLSDLMTLSTIFREEANSQYSELAEIWISNLVATYRYQFIAQGLLKKVAEKVGGQKAIADPNTITWDNNAVDLLVSNLKDEGDQWISVNLKALDSFLKWTSENNLRVVITPGSYHPEAEKHFQAMRTSSKSSLKNLCSKYSNTHYIENDFFGTYETADFKDPTHVTPEAGRRYANSLLSLLSSRFPDKGSENSDLLKN